MKIECAHDKVVKLHELKKHPKNPNHHSPEQIQRLAKIMKYQGWRSPIKVSTRSGFITAGHGRLAAALHNGWTEAPVDVQDYDSDEQEMADLIADNAIALWADLDLAQINAELENLGPDFDIDNLGLENFVLEPADKLPNEKELDENIETDKECPSCGYKWS